MPKTKNWDRKQDVEYEPKTPYTWSHGFADAGVYISKLGDGYTIYKTFHQIDSPDGYGGKEVTTIYDRNDAHEYAVSMMRKHPYGWNPSVGDIPKDQLPSSRAWQRTEMADDHVTYVNRFTYSDKQYRVVLHLIRSGFDAAMQVRGEDGWETIDIVENPHTSLLKRAVEETEEFLDKYEDKDKLVMTLLNMRGE